MNSYEQIKRINLYLKTKYGGFLGVPSEYIRAELLCNPPSDLKTIAYKESGTTFRFYDFISVAEKVFDGQDD